MAGISVATSSLESFTRSAKRIVRIDAFNPPAAKFFKPTFSLRKPQLFRIRLNFIIESRNETLRQLHAISQRELHRIGSELFEIGTHGVRIAERVVCCEGLSVRQRTTESSPSFQARVTAPRKILKPALAGDRFIRLRARAHLVPTQNGSAENRKIEGLTPFLAVS